MSAAERRPPNHCLPSNRPRNGVVSFVWASQIRRRLQTAYLRFPFVDPVEGSNVPRPGQGSAVEGSNVPRAGQGSAVEGSNVPLAGQGSAAAQRVVAECVVVPTNLPLILLLASAAFSGIFLENGVDGTKVSRVDCRHKLGRCNSISPYAKLLVPGGVGVGER